MLLFAEPVHATSDFEVDEGRVETLIDVGLLHGERHRAKEAWRAMPPRLKILTSSSMKI